MTPSRPDPYVHRASVLARLGAIEAAMTDLRGREIAFPTFAESQEAIFRDRLVNRTIVSALLLTHLADAVRGLARATGVAPERITQLVTHSVPLRVLERVTNTWKHGLGRRDKTGALLRNILQVHKNTPANSSPLPTDTVHVIGMLVVDSKDGVFSSSTLLRFGVRHWASLLEPWMPEVSGWAYRSAPDPPGPVITVESTQAGTIPAGAAVVFALPDALTARLSADIRSRLGNQ